MPDSSDVHSPRLPDTMALEACEMGSQCDGALFPKEANAQTKGLAGLWHGLTPE